MFLGCYVGLISTTVVTQAKSNPDYHSAKAAEEKKVEITMEELPEQIVIAFQKSEFSKRYDFSGNIPGVIPEY